MIRETLSVVHRRTSVLAGLGAVDYVTLLIPSHESQISTDLVAPQRDPQIR